MFFITTRTMATKEKKPKDKTKKERPRKTTKLHEACVSGDLELVDSSLAKHKNWIITPNEEGRFPIHLACLSGHLAVVERLLKAADVLNQIEVRPGHWCVLHYAAHSRNKDLFFFLANHPDIKVVANTNRDKNTPMHYFCRFFDENYKNVLNLLAKKGANVNAQNANGETPLHNACWAGHLELVHVLLDLGADPNVVNDHGETPLHWAARMGFVAVVEALLRSSADPEIKGQDGRAFDVTRSGSIKRLLDPNFETEATKQQKDMEQRARSMIEKKRVTPFHWEIEFSELTIQGRLGAGGSGIVHKGLWKNSIEVAVKTLHYENFTPEMFDSLVREITVISKLRHPNVVLFLGACLSPKICIVTELMPRGNLRDLLRHESLDWTRKLNLAIEITRGLQYLHSQTPPVLHRDLKSLNILVDESYHAKVADFGATSPVHEVPEPPREPASGSSSSPNTIEQNYGGTLYCLAPEVLDHKPYTAASDIYSLGLIFYEMASGKVPFEGLSSMQLLRTIDESKDTPLDDLDAKSSPEDFGALVKKCISKNPDDRPSLNDVMTSLRAIKSSQSGQS